MKIAKIKESLITIISSLLREASSSVEHSSIISKVRLELIKENLEISTSFDANDVDRYFNEIVRQCVTLNEELSNELAKPTALMFCLARFLNRTPELKRELMPGCSAEVNPEGIISYFNICSIKATVFEEWIAARSKYHEYAPLGGLDKSVTWSVMGGVVVLRHLQDFILMRGDTRSPEEIITKEGFTPAVPDEDYTDRGNELTLPELKIHFPLRISFSKNFAVAIRYMKNAATRQSRQFSYIYCVNVNNMQTIDIPRNIAEGRLGKHNSKQTIDKFVKNWVDEHVVLGSSIPVSKITKVYKYEIIQQMPASSDQSKRDGFILKGIYIYKDGQFEYKEINYIPSDFHYKSVAMISFNRKKGGIIPYGLGVASPFSDNESLSNLDIQEVLLQRWHNSLPSQYFPLISINFGMARDHIANWRKTIEKIKKGTLNLQAPVKLYIESFGQ